MHRVTEYVKDDWLCVFPYRISNCGYRGLNRQAYALLCFLYYSTKSVLILYWVLIFYICRGLFLACRFIFLDIWKKEFKIQECEWYEKIFGTDLDDIDEEDEDENNEENEEVDEMTEEEPVQEDDLDEIRFSQLFRVGADMCLLVHHVEMCPDETAYIQVVDEEGYTPLYKRKVRRDKQGNRFIVFNSTNYYLDDSKTQPTVKKK